MAASEILMKFTGDLKRLPYRELREFCSILGLKAQIAPAALIDAMVAAAEQINPDVNPNATEAPRRTLKDRIGGG